MLYMMNIMIPKARKRARKKQEEIAIVLYFLSSTAQIGIEKSTEIEHYKILLSYIVKLHCA